MNLIECDDFYPRGARWEIQGKQGDRTTGRTTTHLNLNIEKLEGKIDTRWTGSLAHMLAHQQTPRSADHPRPKTRNASSRYLTIE